MYNFGHLENYLSGTHNLKKSLGKIYIHKNRSFPKKIEGNDQFYRY